MSGPCTPIDLHYAPTASWGEEYDLPALRAQLAPYLSQNLLDLSQVDAPTLVGTDLEFDQLHFYKRILRPRYQAEIQQQNLPTFRPDDLVVKAIAVPGKTTPYTRWCVTRAVENAHIVVMHQKKLFNRARCYQIDPSLAPPFCPPHPAYPSGHSTETHAAAFMLAEILGEASDARVRAATQVVALAQRVARNREFAGVHYDTDTRAGIELAGIVVQAIVNLGDDTFQEQLAGARKEWNAL